MSNTRNEIASSARAPQRFAEPHKGLAPNLDHRTFETGWSQLWVKSRSLELTRGHPQGGRVLFGYLSRINNEEHLCATLRSRWWVYWQVPSRRGPRWPRLTRRCLAKPRAIRSASSTMPTSDLTAASSVSSATSTRYIPRERSRAEVQSINSSGRPPSRQSVTTRRTGGAATWMVF